jgi:hypothetical protein
VKTLRERLMSRLVIDRATGCLLWTGYCNPEGYGRVWVGRPIRRLDYAHRLMYQLFAGSIPDGMQLDHLCRNPQCASPAHLEVVTHRENLLRGTGYSARNAAKTHCPSGHAYDAANTYFRPGTGHRLCRECVRNHSRRRRAVAS